MKGRKKRYFPVTSYDKKHKNHHRKSRNAHRTANVLGVWCPLILTFICVVSLVVLFIVFFLILAQPCSEDSHCLTKNPCKLDTCQEGFCIHTNIEDCCVSDNDCSVKQCHLTYCVNNTCETDIVPDNTYCDDDDSCTVYDACVSGVCSGTTLTCELSNSCRRGECIQGAGCVYTALENGLECDDNNLCTVDDVCWNGMCVGLNKNCSGFDAPCAQGICEVSTGLCKAAPIKQNEPCTDNLFCTVGDKCLNGQCVAGETNPCLNGASCEEETNDFTCTCLQGYTGKICDGVVKAQLTQAVVISGFSISDVKSNPVVQQSIQESIAASAGVDPSNVEILDVTTQDVQRRRLLQDSTAGVNVDYRITLDQRQNVTEVKETLEQMSENPEVQETLIETVKETIVDKRDENPTIVYFNPILFDPIELETKLEIVKIETIIQPEELCAIGHGFRDGICFECEDDQFNNEATTNVSSVCQNRTLCSPGNKSFYKPSIFQDNICVPCDDGTFQPEFNELTSCNTATLCGEGLEVDVLTNKINDTTCRLCDVGYESLDNGPCVPKSICAGVTCFDNNPCTIDACVEQIGCMIQHRDFNSTCIPGCYKDVHCPREYICYDGTCIKLSTSVTSMQIRFIGYEIGQCPTKMVNNFFFTNTTCSDQIVTERQCQYYALDNEMPFTVEEESNMPFGCYKSRKSGILVVSYNHNTATTGLCSNDTQCYCNSPVVDDQILHRLNMNFVLDSEKFQIANDTRFRVILDSRDIQLDSAQPLGFGADVYNLNYNDFGYDVARTAFTVATECHEINNNNCNFIFSNREYRFALKVHDCTDISHIPAKNCIDPKHYVWSTIYASVEDCSLFPQSTTLVYKRDAGTIIYDDTRFSGYHNASDYINITNENKRGIVGIDLPDIPEDVQVVISDLKVCKANKKHYLAGCVDGTNKSTCFNTGCFNWIRDDFQHEYYPLNFEIDIIKDRSITAMAHSNVFDAHGCFPNDQYNATYEKKCTFKKCRILQPEWQLNDGFEFNFKPFYNQRYYDNERIVFDIKYDFVFCGNGTVWKKFAQTIRHQPN